MGITTVLVTGAAGFIGKHLMETLGRRPEVRVLGYDVGNTAEELDRALAEAEVIYHLAGVNRPQDPNEYHTGNAGFTQALCSSLESLGRKPTIVLSSSIQAELDNPYGISKRQAERVVEDYARKYAEDRGRRAEDGGRKGKAEMLKTEMRKGESGNAEDGGQGTEGRGQQAKAIIFRLKNVFGKWCRPNYNSVVATFCHNIAHDLPIAISDPNKELELVYIDDVVAAFTAVLDEKTEGGKGKAETLKTEMLKGESGKAEDGGRECFCYREVERSFKVTLGELASKIRSFRESRQSLRLPSFADDFTRCLYATYLSYLEAPDFAYNLDIKADDRGCLAEFMKSEHFGQVFVSRTKPGITRGNHYHHTKTEKFLVVEGEAVIRFRSIQKSEVTGHWSVVSGHESEVIEYRVTGRDFCVVDIPPGYTHSIENVGNTEMVVLFWASEIFDLARPDTVALPVLG